MTGLLYNTRRQSARQSLAFARAIGAVIDSNSMVGVMEDAGIPQGPIREAVFARIRSEAIAKAKG